MLYTIYLKHQTSHLKTPNTKHFHLKTNLLCLNKKVLKIHVSVWLEFVSFLILPELPVRQTSFLYADKHARTHAPHTHTHTHYTPRTLHTTHHTHTPHTQVGTGEQRLFVCFRIRWLVDCNTALWWRCRVLCGECIENSLNVWAGTYCKRGAWNVTSEKLIYRFK